MAVFWVVVSCSLVEVYWRFRDAYCFHHHHPDGGSKNLQNIGRLLPDYMAQQKKTATS
jgi:hypothetical protein